MSDYHIIDGNNAGEEYRIVFHIAVPDEMNKANSINLRAAVAEDPAIKKPSIVPWIAAAEQAKLDSGELLELVEKFRPDPARTLVQNRATADGRYRELVIVVRDFLRARYALWRFERTVPLP